MARRGLGDEIKKRDPFDSPEQEVALNLARTSDRHYAGFARLFKTQGITGAQYNVLRILRGAGAAGLCRNEIRDRLVAQVPDVTRLLDRLEQMDLVVRDRDAADRRQVNARITRDGLRLLDRLDAPVAESHDRQFERLTERELRTLIDLLAKLRQSH